MSWHEFRCFDFDAMDWPLRRVLCKVLVAVLGSVSVFVFDVVLHAELGSVMLQRQQSRLSCARRFQCLSRDCIDVVTPSNERHVSSARKRCNPKDSEAMRA